MRIWHISDTHGYHNSVTVPDNVDMVIHSGDATNNRNMVENSIELWPFIDWFNWLPIKHKVFVAGNHDSAIEGRMVRAEDFFNLGIHYLENSSCNIEGLKIWGSPVTPTFNDWCFMMGRNKTERVWRLIPDDTDVLVTHGPPQTVLDLAQDFDGTLNQVGDSALMKRVFKVKPKAHCFGHVHDHQGLKNSGMLQLNYIPTVFSNGSCIENRKLDIKNHGNILEIN